ncbi:MAG: hypothetical protein ACK5QX_04355, partial [bacterium]
MPGPWRLPQPVDGFAQAAHGAWPSLLVARWLLHVDHLLQITIQECRLHVQLVQVQPSCRHHRQ